MRIMGILNVTPDSFSDGGRFRSVEEAVEAGARLVEDGAEVVDVGGESTRPGAEPVTEEEELRRVIPVVEGLRARISVPVSVDTSKPAVFREAWRAGATIWNDVTALRGDPGSASLAAATGATVVLMHRRGSPRTMQVDPRYGDVVAEVAEALRGFAETAMAAGVARDRIIVDPGLGFGKAPEHNIALLKGVAAIRRLGFPLLVGASRKAFIRGIIAEPDPARTDFGTSAVTAHLLLAGVEMVRVHNVRAARDTIRVLSALG